MYPHAALYVSQLPPIWVDKFVRRCINISTCMHVHLTLHICPIPFALSHANMYTYVYMSQPCLILSNTLVKRCTCIRTCIHIHLPSRSALIPLHSCKLVHMSQQLSSDPTSWSEHVHASLTPHVCTTPLHSCAEHMHHCEALCECL